MDVLYSLLLAARHSVIRLAPTCLTGHVEPWTGQTVPTQKRSMTRIPAIFLSRRFELFNMCSDPAHPVAKRITKAIGSPSIFSLSFMQREKRRHPCGQLQCFYLCLMNGLHGHMSVLKYLDGA